MQQLNAYNYSRKGADMCVCVCVQVPIEVRDATREKIQSLETERGQLEGALAGFRSMKE